MLSENMVKEIVIGDEVFNFGFHQVRERFAELKHKYATKIVNATSNAVKNNEALCLLDESLWFAFEKFDRSKGASFYTYLSIKFTDVLNTQIRKENTEKRLLETNSHSLHSENEDDELDGLNMLNQISHNHTPLDEMLYKEMAATIQPYIEGKEELLQTILNPEVHTIKEYAYNHSLTCANARYRKRKLQAQLQETLKKYYM